MQKIVINPENVCADHITVTVDGDIIDEVDIQGGCDGNSQAVARLLKGVRVKEAVKLLSGIDCGGKGTSCADQLAKGLCNRTTRIITRSDDES